jgi:tetratricopeptide (TPR) repeat protein
MMIPAPFLSNRAYNLYRAYKEGGAKANLDQAIYLAQITINLTTTGSSNRPMYLNNLANYLHSRFDLEGAENDLDRAIHLAQEVADLTPVGSSNRPTCLNNLALYLQSKYTLDGIRAHLDRAIDLAQEAIELVPKDSSDRASHLNNLAIHLSSRYEATGTTADLDRAINLSEDAVNITPVGSINRSANLNCLALCLLSRYKLNSATEDLDRAIELTQEAIDVAPMGSSGRPRWLSNLALHIFGRYALTSAKGDLQRSISLTEEAIDLTPARSKDMPARLSNLADYLHSRYEIIGAKSDLDRAIELAQCAIDLMPTGSSSRPICLINLASFINSRYTLLGAEDDLDRAINLASEAVDLTPAGSNRPTCLNNLALYLRSKYKLDGKKTHLDRAIDLAHEAIELSPAGFSDRPKWLNNLAFHLVSRYDTTGTKNDLDRAIDLAQQAIDLMPADSSYKPTGLNNLALHLLQRYSMMSDPADLDRILQSLRDSATSTTGAVITRLQAYQGLSSLHCRKRNWNDAADVGCKAIDLLPALSPRFLAKSDRHRLLGMLSGLATNTAAAYLHLGDVLNAIKSLEQGRAVLAGDIFDTRALLLQLKRHDPELAGRFTTLRDKLNASSADEADALLPALDNLKGRGGDRGIDRARASEEFDRLIEEIRQLPGFAEFLQPPSEMMIRSTAAEGPVIYVNVSDFRCDAFVIQSDATVAIPLPQLHVRDIKLQGANLRGPAARQTEMLEWLWDTVASPIMDYLGLSTSPSHEPTRIWWIPTGLLTSFPLHAAGYHDRRVELTASKPVWTVLDCAMSSFSTSLKALQQIRAMKSAPKSATCISLVAMYETPEAENLPFAQKEAEVIKQICEDTRTRIDEVVPAKGAVLAALQHCDIFHFAGHGQAHPMEPLHSKLLLSDWESEPLAVEDVLGASDDSHLPTLAYLSACETGQIKNPRALDECMHLISAFQLAGFRHVIGSLWQVDDDTCQSVAQSVYEEILHRPMTDASVCLALHRALKSQRDLLRMPSAEDVPRGARDYGTASGNGTMLCYWVPYVHFGA